MKAFAAPLLRRIGIALASACAIPATSSAATPPDQRPLVIAHRGGAALMPENTFPAWDNAIRLGADMLEFDIEVTADDRLIVTHDGSVNPTFCSADPASGVQPGPIRSLTLADLGKFDCGSRHRAIYPNQTAVPGARMPSFDALLARYRKGKQLLYGETKMPGPNEGEVDPVAFASQVAHAVHKYGLESRFILQSSDYRTIDAMHAINPRIRTCLLSPWLAKIDYVDLARQHHATCMLLRLQDADAAEIQRLRAAGILTVSEVIDDEDSWAAYRRRGFEALFTNDPASLIRYLHRPASKP